MIASVMAALDGTAIAPRVLAVATEIAERFDAKMYLFRAIHVPPEFPAAAAHALPDDPLPASLTHRAAAELLALAAGNPRASNATLVIEEGDPWRAIIAASDRLSIDLVVMGSHTYHWPDQLFGTVAARLANRGHRNVLIVHA